MKKKNNIKVVFHHGDFSERSRGHEYFGPNGSINLQLNKISNQSLHWVFRGGFIHKDHHRFWKTIIMTDILFIKTINMDYEDMDMHWDHAEASMLAVLTEIKKLNPSIKIFFFEDLPENVEEFSKFGTFITDLHGDKELLSYFQNL